MSYATMKLNIGCGLNKVPGYINIDKYSSCVPDLVMDAEMFPWPFETGQVEEVLFNHSLEHMGKDTNVFLGIIQELYRVCKHGAKVQINVPHPRHDDFINDPSHVRIITPEMMALFSKKQCLHWQQERRPNTPFALYLDVDFEATDCKHVLSERYQSMFMSGELCEEEIDEAVIEKNNVIATTLITLNVIKT